MSTNAIYQKSVTGTVIAQTIRVPTDVLATQVSLAMGLGAYHYVSSYSDPIIH